MQTCEDQGEKKKEIIEKDVPYLDLNEFDSADSEFMKNLITDLLNRTPDPNNMNYDLDNDI